MFPETISFKMFETNYSFYFLKNLNAVFQDLFASNNKNFQFGTETRH